MIETHNVKGRIRIEKRMLFRVEILLKWEDFLFERVVENDVARRIRVSAKIGRKVQWEG